MKKIYVIPMSTMEEANVSYMIAASLAIHSDKSSDEAFVKESNDMSDIWGDDEW